MKINHPGTCIVLAFLLCAPILCAQTGDPKDDKPDPAATGAIESAVETAAEGDPDDAELLDELDGYRRTPIKLYAATAAALSRLPGISRRDAERILAFVRDSAVADFARLGKSVGLTSGQISVLRAYATLSPAASAPMPDTLYLNLSSYVAQDLQSRRGFTDAIPRVQPRRGPNNDSLGLDTVPIGAPYLGSRQSYAARLLLRYGAFDGGVTFKKDAGEPVVYKDTAAYLYAPGEYVDPAQPVGQVRTWLGAFASANAGAALGPVAVRVGDYSAEFGQGLVMWNGFGGHKSGDVVRSPYKSARGITAYHSTGEALFFRGAAVTLNEGQWLPRGFRASAFASVRKLDASLYGAVDPAGNTSAIVGSVYQDGYHRTHAELRRAGTLDETLFGANVQYRFDGGGHAGVTGYASRTSAVRHGTQFYDYSGDHVRMIGIDGEYKLGAATFFGEAARSVDGTIGMLGGVNASVGGAQISVAGRNLPATFYTPHGTGFGESALHQQNERGLYLGVRAPVTARGALSAYLDLYRFPERSYLVPQPASGIDGYLRFEYAPSRRLRFAIQLRDKRKGSSLTVSDTFGRDARVMIDREQISGRLESEYSTSDGCLRLRGRFERTFVSYSGALPAASGLMTYADIQYRPVERLRLGFRMALFDTDNYDAAVSGFEQELAGRSGSATLSGRGRRSYLFAQWRPIAGVTLTAKYAETYYADRPAISAGTPQQIDGPLASDVAVQVEWTP